MQCRILSRVTMRGTLNNHDDRCIGDVKYETAIHRAEFDFVVADARSAQKSLQLSTDGRGQ